jgi:methylated-DNA-[protein]-cysteine S-methyltransferase
MDAAFLSFIKLRNNHMPNHNTCSSVLISPLGKIGISTIEGRLSGLDWLDDNASLLAPQDPASKKIAAQLADYFSNPSTAFELEVHLQGSVFQKKVWQALQAIPGGTTLTYGMLAKQLESSPRAIGQACRSNPIPIIIPCHRIVAAKHLGGYAGATTGKLMQIKTWLLQHEGG